jgi:ISXO2 transposase-like protein
MGKNKADIKRGVMGSFHSISEQHLQRYVEEFAFRWNNRSALGIEDTERASRMVKGAVGRRLTYRRPDAATPLVDDGVPF